MAIFKYITENGTGIDLKQVEADLSGNESNKEEIEDATVKTDAEVDIKKVEEDLSGNESNKEEIEDATTKTDDGIDLKQVEDDLSDNASNEEEIEAAGEGLVGDPVEEAFYIMYETTYNMNELMKAVGIAELKEAYNGKELILEAVDINAFFTRIVEMLKSALNKIKTIVNEFLTKHMNIAKSDKELVSKHKDAIIKGFDSDEFKINGFVFEDDISFKRDELIEKYDMIDPNKFSHKFHEWCDKYRMENATDEEANNAFDSDALNNEKANLYKAISEVYAVKVESDKDISSALSKKFRNNADDAVDLKDKIDANKIIAILNNDTTAQTLKADFLKLQKDYNAIIDAIYTAQKKYSNKETADNKMFMVANYYSKLAIAIRNTINVVFATVIREDKAKRDQARRIAKIAIHSSTIKKASATDEDGNTLKAEVIESAQISNAFANIKIV